MLDLLFLFNKVGENAGNILNYVCIGIIVLVIAVFLVLCLTKKQFDTKEVAFAGVCLSASFVLSFIKIAPVQYGGSITLASMLPVMLFAYYYGFAHGLLVGVIYGVLQFIQEPYILTPVTFALDYILAFASISLMGIAGKLKEKMNRTGAIAIGASCVYLCRFLMHFFSGLVYFELGEIWVSLPADSAVVYSLLYQIVYLVPDFVITLAAFIVLDRTGVIDKLRFNSNKKAPAAASVENTSSENK